MELNLHYPGARCVIASVPTREKQTSKSVSCRSCDTTGEESVSQGIAFSSEKPKREEMDSTSKELKSALILDF